MEEQGDAGVISVGMLAKIRRMHLRDGLSIREVSRRTGLSRNTVREWLRQDGVTEPKYPKRAQSSVLDAWAEQLEAALRADLHRSVRERRTAKALFEQIRALGYTGSYPRVVVWVRRRRMASPNGLSADTSHSYQEGACAIRLMRGCAGPSFALKKPIKPSGGNMKAMKTRVAVVAIVMMSGAAHAALVDRGGGLIYDDVLNITWLQDANYARTSGYDADGEMGFNSAKVWADTLVYHDSVRNVDYDDWRLARNSPIDHPFHYGWWTDGIDVNPTGGPHSELSYMYYMNLGLIGYRTPGGAWYEYGIYGTNVAGGQNDVGLIKNLQGGEYWSDSAPEPYPYNRPWTFTTNSGNHQVRDYESFFAWAVRDGDVATPAPVPVPAAWGLFLAGLGAMRLIARVRAH